MRQFTDDTKSWSLILKLQIMKGQIMSQQQMKIYPVIQCNCIKEDCVLLPRSQRRKTFWRVPRKKKGVAFGFGQSNVWFARGEDDNKYLSDFLDRLENQIEPMMVKLDRQICRVEKER